MELYCDDIIIMIAIETWIVSWNDVIVTVKDWRIVLGVVRLCAHMSRVSSIEIVNKDGACSWGTPGADPIYLCYEIRWLAREALQATIII